MAGLMIRIIDSRVGKSFDPPLPTDIVCGPRSDLELVFADVLDQAFTRKIGTMIIMSHAFYETDDTGAERFGFGVELGRQNIYLHNAAALFGRFAGKFAEPKRGIELRGCGPAARSEFTATRGGAPMLRVGDGIQLCQLIADSAMTGVRASSDAQPGICRVVPTSRTTRSGASITTSSGDEVALCKEGVWSGNVWQFSPNATAPVQVRRR